MDLRDKKAFVTGGSGGIGGSIARSLAEAGADVAISYVGNLEGANATADALRAMGRRSLTVQMDQRDAASISAAVGAVIGEFGGLDILVNNAAWNIGIPFPQLETLTGEIWDQVLETNLRGPYLLSRAFASHLRRGGSGRIVNIASAGGVYPGSSSIAYSCSKAALIHLTRCLAVALAPEVSVNCVAPGLVEGTRMANRLPQVVANAVRDQVVLRRLPSAEDIAQQVVEFCRSDSVSGQVIVIDGGMPGCMR